MHGPDEFVKLYLQVRVISKRMAKDGVVVDDIREGCGIQGKENKSQNRSPRDSTANGLLGRATVSVSYSLSYQQ